MLREIEKLRAVQGIGVDAEVFAGIAPGVVSGWRARAAVEAPSHLRSHPAELRLTLLAALLHEREREITDTLVDLLISTVHRVGARAETKVSRELVNAFKRVSGKENLLFRVAEASLAAPDASVREVVFPAVAGGEQTLRDLVQEYKTSGPIYRRTVQTTLRASYTNHYRRGLIRLLEVLEFRSSAEQQPVLEALELVRRHASSGASTYYPLGESVPVHRGVRGDWEDVVYREDSRGQRRVVRMVYEVATFQALRDALRCKEVWVLGADRFRDPDQDLPADYAKRRAEHYRTLRKPLDPSAFVAELQEQMREELGALNDALPDLEWLSIAEQRSGAIKLSPLEAQPEPRNLRRVKGEVLRRWGSVGLVDMLKETILRTGCLDTVTSRATGSSIPRSVLAERLLLAIYAYGTNTGLRAVASAGHGHSEDELRYIRRRYLSPESAAQIAVQIADATFAARQASLWGESSTAVASDSTHVRAFDQNLLSEWHTRYRGRGALIYWHVERRSIVVHSQLLACSASEIAAMVEGAMRHATTMHVQGNYTDSHGQSEIGFAITRLLGFDLLPRIKQINRVRLYRPQAGQPTAYPRLTPALTRPIRWDLVTEQYDQTIKYATAIRTGTASTEAILRRFTRHAAHPTYAAMLEVGRAQKTIFLVRYLKSRQLQREIHDGLNVIESWSAANAVLAYGKGGEIATNRRDEQELFVLCLRILQAALVYINAHAPRRPRPASMGPAADPGGPPRDHPALLATPAPLRRHHPRHDQSAQAGPIIARRGDPRGGRSASPVVDLAVAHHVEAVAGHVVAAWAAVDDVAGAIDGDDGVVAGAGVDAVGILAAVEPFVARAAFQDVPSAGNTRDGLAAARARGRKGGRRPRLAPEQVLLAQELYDAGERTVQQIADLFGVPRTTVYGHLKGSGQRPRGAAAVAAPDESPS